MGFLRWHGANHYKGLGLISIVIRIAPSCTQMFQTNFARCFSAMGFAFHFLRQPNGYKNHAVLTACPKNAVADLSPKTPDSSNSSILFAFVCGSDIFEFPS